MTEQSRTREVIRASVEDAYGNKTEITALNGMLPEDCLELMMKQSIIFLSNGYTPDEIRGEWHGPNEDIQQIMCSGSASIPEGES
jgi:hypothetical protein